ncbi:MAG: transketolase [Candidatus Vogelbacteria bacterium GWA1_51_14]|uniref:Transketolase n=1 Tax=Candidatus Vogelbacteria bacterium GWA1_51_14 TaxID=1802435 RepID=A0A1G2QC53_9BACT|nr:MAG: transketolase [Candidatus Vogelbacteria bacterium GWA1_51_14]
MSLNPKQKLNDKLFDVDVEQAPIRNGFGDGLLAAGEADPQVVALCADLTESARAEKFVKAFPERFVQIGVAEQNLASVASGMAAMGKKPFITSYAMFSPGRNWEQIRTTICYNDRPVIIAGSHAGVSVGPDGGTHQAVEDLAITRVVPNLTVIAPCDALEAKRATIEAAKLGKPVYLRLAREKTPIITTDASPFKISKANLLWQGEAPQVTIIACGGVVHNALVAAKELGEKGIGAEVLNLHTIKPIDTKAIVDSVKKTGAVVTVEEHQVAGGMGSAVAEVLAGKLPAPIEFIGVHDQFGQSGTPAELIEHYRIGVSHIVAAAKKAIKRKK